MSSRELAHRSGSGQPAQLADVLERVLDKGIVIAGDIQINLLDIELLTVRLRLLVASADKINVMTPDENISCNTSTSVVMRVTRRPTGLRSK